MQLNADRIRIGYRLKICAVTVRHASPSSSLLMSHDPSPGPGPTPGAALTDSQLRYLVTALSHADYVVLLRDMAGRVDVYMNRTIEQVLGYTQEQLEGVINTQSSYFHPDEQSIRESWRHDLQRAALEQPVSVELSMRDASGRWRRFRRTAQIHTRTESGDIGWLTIVQSELTTQAVPQPDGSADPDSRRHEEEQYAQGFSRQRLRAVLDSIDEAVWTRTADAAVVTFATVRIEELTGRGIAGLRRRGDWDELIDPDHLDRVQAARIEARRVGAASVDYRLRHEQTGEWRWLRDRIRWVVAPGGREHFVGTTSDITAKREAKHRAASLQANAEQVRAETRSLERETIAGDLHDGVAQLLVAADTRLARATDDPTQIEKAREILRLAQTQLRAVASSLLPPTEDGFEPALRTLSQQVAEIWDLPLRLDPLTGAEEFETLAATTRVELYWIIHEAVTNAARHANAAEIWVRWEASDPEHGCIRVESAWEGEPSGTPCDEDTTSSDVLASVPPPRVDRQALGERLLQARARRIGWVLNRQRDAATGQIVVEVAGPLRASTAEHSVVGERVDAHRGASSSG